MKNATVNKNTVAHEGADGMSLNKMGTMPIGKLMFTMSLPPILSMLIQAIYNIIDSIIVSGLAEEALTAVTLIFPVQLFLAAMGAGTGVGINSLISRRLGEKRYDEANKVTAHGFVLAGINYIIFLIIGLFLTKPFVYAFCDGDMLVASYAIPYCQILCIGSIFANYLFVVEKIVQSTGNMVHPMICSLLSAVVKIVLNPCLVRGYGPFPEMGIKGAATATIIGQACGIALLLFFFFTKKQQVRLSLKGFRFNKNIMKNIYVVGGPAIVMQSIGSVMTMGLNAILMPLSSTAVAVSGAYFRLQSFVIMPIFGLTQGCLPICGYNFGAKNKARFMSTYKRSLLVGFIIMIVGVVVFLVGAPSLIGMFNPSEEMLTMGSRALRIICISFLPAAFGICTSTVFQATGHGFYSLITSLCRQMIGILPIAWIFARTLGVDYVWFAIPLAEIISVGVCSSFLVRLYKRQLKNLGQTLPVHE